MEIDKRGVMMEEIKELQKGVNDILVEIGKLQTEMKNLSVLPMQVLQNERTTILLEQRLNTLTSRVDNIEKGIQYAERDKKNDKKWLIGLFAGSAALIWKVFDFLVQSANIK